MRAVLISLIFSIVCYPAPLRAEAGKPVCEQAGIKVLTDFQGGNINGCEFASDGRLTISVAPEDEPINSSPWYAFRLLADVTTNVAMVLDYGNYKHRYTPDFSIDGVNWQTYPATKLDLNNDKSRAGFSLKVPQDKSVVIAAQPLLTSSHYATWLESLKAQHGVTVSSAGPSVDGRQLWRVTSPAKKHTLLLLGRQHPPETTGALALISFVERLFEDDALATRFHDQVGILLYPLINPDGVDKGLWRHNVGGKDLNREWGRFSQPENRIIDSDVSKWLETHDTELIKAIDFHSTHYEVFYTQPDQSASTMPGLLGDWLAQFEALMRSQFDDFDIRRQVSESPQVNAAKHYFFTKYGISSTTLEIGDETDRGVIKAYGRAAAESFMSAYFEQLSAGTAIDNRPLDLMFKGGLVVDGMGAPPYEGDVGVR